MRKSLLLLPVILALMTASVSCGPKAHEGHEHGVAEAATYVCPMHPEVQSDKPGQCSKCGMDLKSAASDAHDHSTHQH